MTTSYSRCPANGGMVNAREVMADLSTSPSAFSITWTSAPSCYLARHSLFGTYVLVLLLFRSYLGRRLTAVPVLVVGIAWFSLVDFQSALWSTLVNNYLVLFFVVLATYVLLARRHYPRLFFALGVVVAVMASLSFIEGFLVWPLGLICLLWSSKRNKTELRIWVIAAALISVAYFHGYDFANPACNPALKQCSLTYG